MILLSFDYKLLGWNILERKANCQTDFVFILPKSCFIQKIMNESGTNGVQRGDFTHVKKAGPANTVLQKDQFRARTRS